MTYFAETKGTPLYRKRLSEDEKSNGKIEKWFDLYELYRDEFSTFDEFIHWYNCVRPHGSLDPKGLKTPEEAFWERLPERRI
jgi:hypothetical protein